MGNAITNTPLMQHKEPTNLPTAVVGTFQFSCENIKLYYELFKTIMLKCYHITIANSKK
jgi:hypothetical protein